MTSDYKDLLSEFIAHGVEFLVVGAHALAAHGYTRATRDLDIWIRPSGANSVRAIAALKAFGAPLLDLTSDDLERPGIVFQIGVEPIRIDILTAIDGLEFEHAWKDRVQAEFVGLKVQVVSKHHLIQNKKAAGRKQDLVDIDNLQSD